MTQFPSLRPSNWDIQFGEFPASVLKSADGRDSIVSHSDREIARQWPATFQNITYAQFAEILAHWEEHGTVYSFLFSTTTLPAADTPTGYRWRYASQPQIVDSYLNIHTVSCQFECRYFPGTTLPPAFAAFNLTADPVAFTATPAAPSPPALTVLGLTGGATTDGFVEVTGLQPGGSWEYSTNGGTTWTAGQGSGFRLSEGTASAGQVQVRQITTGGTSTPAQNAAAITVAPQGSAIISIPSLAGGATATGTVTLPALGFLTRVEFSRAGWLTLYASAAAASADASRGVLTSPAEGAGVIADPRLAAAGVQHLNPFESVRSEESPAITSYPWRFKNEGATGAVLIVLTYVSL